MGGPSWYRGVVSGGYPICSFRQFLARMCRFATIQIVTDRQTTTDDIGYQRRPNGRPKRQKSLIKHLNYTGWARKTGLFLKVDNFATVSE